MVACARCHKIMRCTFLTNDLQEKQKSSAFAELHIYKSACTSRFGCTKLCIENRTRKETNEVKFWKLELVLRTVVQALGQLVSLN